MDDLNITPERRREIDEILKETQRRYENGEIKSMTLEEFLEGRQKRWEDKLLNQVESDFEMRIERLKNIITVFGPSKTQEELYQMIISKKHYKDLSREEFDRLYLEEKECHAGQQ